jgi:hypothetical protein
VRADRPSAHWFYLPALLLLALVWWTQGRRMKVHAKGAPVSAGA